MNISIRRQIHNNAVALISIAIAVSALACNTWRNETTEQQRNIRHAAFRVLEVLGEVQEVVDSRFYYLAFGSEIAAEGELRIRGFGSVAMIRDLMSLMAAPGPEAGKELHQLWLIHLNSLDQLDDSGQHSQAAKEAERERTQAVGRVRVTVLEILRSLE